MVRAGRAVASRRASIDKHRTRLGAALAAQCRARTARRRIARAAPDRSRQSHRFEAHVHLPRRVEAAASSIRAEHFIRGDRRSAIRKAHVALTRSAAKILGPLASFLTERDSVQLGGTINVIRPGLGQFLVQDVARQARSAITARAPTVAEIRRGVVPPGVAQNGFPMPLPEYISDVRIADGRITIYRNAQ